MIEIDRSHWRRVRFGDVIQSITDRVDDPSTAGVERYVGLEHLDAGSLTINRWGSPADVEATKLRFEPGDVVFARRRAYQRKLGQADFEGIASAHSLVLRALPDSVRPEFLPVFLSSDVFMDRAIQISVGSLSPTVNWKTLAIQEFDLPPLDEQKRISQLLWAMEQEKRARESLVSAMLAALDARVEQAVSGKGVRLAAVELETVADIASGLTVNSRREQLPNRVPYLRVANVRRSRLDLSEVKSIGATDAEVAAKQLQPGDVLVVEGHADYRQVGRAALWSGELDGCLHQNHIFRVRPGATVLPAYVEAVLNSCVGRRYFESRSKSTSGLTTINSRVLKAAPVAPLPRASQEQLVEELSAMRHAIDEAAKAMGGLERLRVAVWNRVWGTS